MILTTLYIEWDGNEYHVTTSPDSLPLTHQLAMLKGAERVLERQIGAEKLRLAEQAAWTTVYRELRKFLR